MKALKIFLILVLVAYVAMNWYMYANQRQLMYFPATDRVTPAQVGLANVHEVMLQSASGLELVSWYGVAESGRPTILFFHGNGGAVQHRAYRFRQYMAQGYGVFVLGYPGYGGNSGQPSEESFREASELAYEYLQGRGVLAQDMVIYGQSLGSAVAVQLAARVDANGLILEAPMSSTVDVAAHHYSFLLVNLLMKDTYKSIDYIERINMPLLVMHGSDDRIIPIEFGRTLFDKASDPKRFEELRGAGHNNLSEYGVDALATEFIEVLQSNL